MKQCLKQRRPVRRLLVGLVVMATGGYLLVVFASNYRAKPLKTAGNVGPPESTKDMDLTDFESRRRGSALELLENRSRIEKQTPTETIGQLLQLLKPDSAAGNSTQQGNENDEASAVRSKSVNDLILLNVSKQQVTTQTVLSSPANENAKTEIPKVEDTQNMSSKAAEHDGGALKCSQVRRPRDGEIVYRHKYWQVLTDGVEDVVLFSAFYDNRPIVGALPWLRILGVRKQCPVSDQNLFCHVWYSTQLHPFVTQADVISTGGNTHIAGGLTYGQRQFSCLLPDVERVPSHVSLVISRCAVNSSTFLPVIVPVTSPVAGRWLHEFSLCAEVNFGSLPAAEVVEWIELNALFGVSQFYIYNGNFTDAKTIAVLEHYGHQGLVQLIPMPPSVEDYSVNGVRLASPASLNDCMLRSMYASRFVVVIDLDEVIVPRLHSNYSQLIDHVDRTLQLNQSYHTYSFRNAYFFTYFSPDDTQPSFMRTARLRYRAPPSDYLFGAKSFVDPRRCLSVFNHYCWVQFKEASDPRFGTSVDVPADVGLSHHYRAVCPDGLGKERCNSYDRDKVKDDIILKFRPVVEERVRATLELLKLL